MSAPALSLLILSLAAQPLSVEDAIRAAWDQNPAVLASAANVEAAREDASRAGKAHLPSVSLQVKGVYTDEPLMAFGLKLDQARVTPQDFDPERLNDPDAVGAWAASAAVLLPVYVGGRLSAGERATDSMAEATAADHERTRRQLAAHVVEAYFASKAAEQGVVYAEDLVAHARETERFVKERAGRGLALDADVARAAAFRASAEAQRADAEKQRASARSALALLAGASAFEAELTTTMERDEAPPDVTTLPDRADLRAATLRSDAAQAAADAARGALLPAVFVEAAAEAVRTADLDEGSIFGRVGGVVRWDFTLGVLHETAAAEARARAASEALAFRRREAEREVAEARRALVAAEAKVRSATEAVAASESARALREARHREGLLPLTDVLDAESGLSGARALLLRSRLEARVARAHLSLALDRPIEGLDP